MSTSTLHFLGCDRSDYWLDFTLLRPDGSREDLRLAARAAPIEKWLAEWRRRHPHDLLAVGFEQPASNLIALFTRFEFVVLYPLNPATLCFYREAFVTSKAKDDPDDSFWLADLVRTHRDKLTAWKAQSGDMRKLQALVEARRDTVNRLTALSNQLISLLKSYFPEALELIGEDKTAPLALAFLRRWPTLSLLKKCRWPSIEAFYRENCCRRRSALEKRRELIREAHPLTEDPAILEPTQMRLQLILDLIEPARAALGRFDEAIAGTFNRHPDHVLMLSLPGAAKVYAPRLLAGIGEQRERFVDARALQCFSGIAPVLIRSGRSSWIKRRHACPKFIRQSFHEWAGESIRHCRWARAYYQQQRSIGKEHHTVARALAFKWQRIIFRCWQQHTCYDDSIYMRSLQKRNPDLYNLALNTTLPKHAKN